MAQPFMITGGPSEGHRMPSLRYQLFGLALKGFALSGAERAIGRRFAGNGVILTLHHVRGVTDRIFSQNALLEITPTFLEQIVRMLFDEGYEIIPIDQMATRIANPDPARPFAVLTFDDGYIDNRDVALPILRRYEAPFTVYVTPGYADRTTSLWWLDLEDAIRQLDVIDLMLPTGRFTQPATTMAEKDAAFRRLYWRLREIEEIDLRATVDTLAQQAGFDPLARIERLCLDWRALRDFAREPLVTIGAHTLTHPRLRMLDDEEARNEIFGSKARIEQELGRAVKHFAYPVGDKASAGPRDFQLCAEAGFETAVTNRSGVIYDEHAAHMMALPRICINGLYQDIDFLRALVRGAALYARNLGRRVSVD